MHAVLIDRSISKVTRIGIWLTSLHRMKDPIHAIVQMSKKEKEKLTDLYSLMVTTQRGRSGIWSLYIVRFSVLQTRVVGWAYSYIILIYFVQQKEGHDTTSLCHHVRLSWNICSSDLNGPWPKHFELHSATSWASCFDEYMHDFHAWLKIEYAYVIYIVTCLIWSPCCHARMHAFFKKLINGYTCEENHNTTNNGKFSDAG